MSRNVRFLCLFAVFTLTTCPTYGQVQAGTPAFGSFGGGPDVINLGNLNAALRISGLNKPGRGLSAQTEFTFNTWIWVPVTLGSTTSWQQVSNWGLDATQPFLGYLTNTSTQTGCSGGAYVTITNFAFHDPFGTSHPFSGYVIIPIASGCGQVEHDLTSLASDGSGLTLNYSQTIHTIVDRNGDVTVVSNSQTSGGQKTDRNGNFLSYNFSTGVMTDTLGQSVRLVHQPCRYDRKLRGLVQELHSEDKLWLLRQRVWAYK